MVFFKAQDYDLSDSNVTLYLSLQEPVGCNVRIPHYGDDTLRYLRFNADESKEIIKQLKERIDNIRLLMSRIPKLISSCLIARGPSKKVKEWTVNGDETTIL